MSRLLLAVPRRRVVTALLALVLVTSACKIGTSTTDKPSTPDGTPGTPGTIATGSACFTPPSLSAGEPAASGAGDEWQPLTLSADADNCFRMSASSSDALGVAPDSAFLLETQDALTAEEVAALLAIDPPLDFDVELVEETSQAQPLVRLAHAADGELPNRYRIVPKEPLAEGQVYRVALLDQPAGEPLRSWSFQAQRPLAVVQSLPANEASDVPLDTGIELTFNADGVQDIADKVRFDPPIEGSWELHKRTASFVPKALAPNTLYTLTVAEGLGVEGTTQTLAEPYRVQFQTGSGSTGDLSQPPTLGFSRLIWEAPTGQAPVVAMYGWGPDGSALQPGALPFTVSRYAGPEDFVAALDQAQAVPNWASAARGQYEADAADLPVVASFEAEPRKVGEANDLVVTLPEALPAGYYLVQAESDGRKIPTWLQVTDLAPYVAVAQDKTLLWVNDVTAPSPVSGAVASGLGDTEFKATTGADGTALVDTPDGMVKTMQNTPWFRRDAAVGNLLVRAGDKTAVVPLGAVLANQSGSPFRGFGNPGADNYWRYLYTDRHLYRPSDTVHAWGVVRPRDGAAGGLALTLELVDNGNLDFNFQPTVLASTEVSTGATGTFSGTLPIAGVAPGYYDLRVRAGDQVVASTYAEVRNFVKPAYKIDVTPSSASIFTGDSITMTTQTSFFEGSPLPGVGLKYDLQAGRPISGTLTTDANGAAVLRIPELNLGQQDYAYQPFDWVNMYVTPQLAEEGDIAGSGMVRVFRSGLDIAAEGKVSEGQAAVSGTVYTVDPSTSADVYGYDPASWRGAPAAGVPVTAEIMETTWERIQEGETYDFVSKTVQPKYRYESREVSLGEQRLTTEPDGTFVLGFPADAEKTYNVRLSVTDDADRRYATQIGVGGTGRYYQPDQYATLDGPQTNRFQLGDEVALTMQRGGEPMPSGTQNDYLFMQAQNGLRDITLQNNPNFKFEFAEEDIPNVHVLGVRFTGDTYQEVMGGYSAQFDQSGKKLDVTVTPAKAGYAPGDEATLEVAVTDAEGKPAAAAVLLSAVDEAIYRLQGGSFYDDLGILNALYQSVGTGIVQTYATHQVPLYSGGAEGGGGGGGRSDFKDTALFTEVTTGADGKGTARFKLPDNLTSWRVAALGVTDDLAAGSGSGAVPVSLPAFVDATLSDSYLASDKPGLRLRAYGAELKDGDAVSFEVSSPTLLDAPLKGNGTAFNAVTLPLDKLTPGEHTLQIALDSPAGKDLLERKLTVLPSRLARAESSYEQLAEGATWQPPAEAADAVTLLLADGNRGRYLPALEGLAWGSSSRVDQRVATLLAQRLLSQYFNQGAGAAEGLDLSAYVNEDGGYGLLPYGGSDLALSAQVALAAPADVGRQPLARYFREVVDDAGSTREQVAIALAGLAAVGQPLLPDVQALAALDDLTWRERLYLGLAAAALADQATAATLYRAALAADGQQRGDTVRLNVGSDQDDVLEASGLAAQLGARLGDNQAPRLFNYVAANAATDQPTDLARAAFLTQALPLTPAEATKASYLLDGKRQTVDLAPGRATRLQVPAAALETLDLKAEAGTLGVTLSTVAPLELASLQADPDLKLARSYAEKGDPAEVAESDLVKITLDYTLGDKAVDGCYLVTDLLPSGLYPVTRPWVQGIADDKTAWPIAVDGQRVTFCVTKDGDQKPLTYYARVVGPGEYTAESATLQSGAAPESVAATKALRVDVK